MKVYVVGKNRWCGPSTASMFAARGWTVVGDEILSNKEALNSVDLVVFTGGADVSPHIYGEENHASHCDEARDQFELDVYYSLTESQAKAGICRGHQFLNCLAGGKLIQDHGHLGSLRKVAGYINGRFPKTEEKGRVTVCHHQGVLAPEGDAIDHESLMWIGLNEYRRNVSSKQWPIYAGYYPQINTVGVQWHPEWGHETDQSESLFFDMLKKYLGISDTLRKAA